jgi:apoptotic chromatin condensation inducer in the nucleus
MSDLNDDVIANSKKGTSPDVDAPIITLLSPAEQRSNPQEAGNGIAEKHEAVVSGEEIIVEDTVIDNKEQNKTEKSYHVRIDNFQRPLTDKLLFDWLNKTLGHEILKENLWMNKIKTHCYVDFDSLSLAEACITAVTGSKVDSKHTMQLVADMTDVSALEAETAPEAKMKPNEWKNNKNLGLNSLPQKTAPAAATAHISGSSVDVINNDVVMKAVNLQLVASNSTKNSESRPESRHVTGNEQVGFSTRRNRINNGTGITKSAEEVSLKRQRVESVGSEGRVLQGRKVNDQNEDEDALELDTLFRKTKAIPPLYWLPITEDIVKYRKEHLIKNK